MNKNEHIQCLADHATFLRSLSHLTPSGEVQKLMKANVEAVIREAGIVLAMMSEQEPTTKQPA